MIEVRGDGRWAELSVRDHGLGIPGADVGRIFDPLHRASNVGRVAGTGLGLSSVRRIVEGYGGAVDVATREGVGTTISVRLPVTPPDATS